MITRILSTLGCWPWHRPSGRPVLWKAMCSASR